MAIGVINQFGLNRDELSVLVSFQNALILNDIKTTDSMDFFGENKPALVALKNQWHQRWKKKVVEGFNALDTIEPPQIYSVHTSQFRTLKQSIKNTSKLTRGLIALELSAFEPYFPLVPEDVEEKTYKSIAISNGYLDCLNLKLTELGFTQDYGSHLRDSIESAQRSISGFWWKIVLGTLAGLGLGALTMGLAAPAIAAAVGGAMGLSGAAAFSAGLALIGGGAIATGGLGMAGGIMVLVGGGAILGLGVGSSVGLTVANISSGSVLSSAAKLEVILKEFILQGQRDIVMAQEILKKQREAIQRLETEVDTLKLEREQNRKRIEDLERAIKYLKESLKRNQAHVRNHKDD